MTNSWTKQGDSWAVQCPTQQAPGAVVTVTNRKGESKTVTLGALVASTRWGFVYAVAQAPKASREEALVGTIDNIMAIFDRTAKRLKFPAIELNIPETGVVVRVNVATARAKVPGSLTITGARQGETGERPWYGRVTKEGVLQPSREAPQGLGKRLAEFAADPAKVAREYGRLTARCCFCRLPLGGDNPNSPSGRKSLAVGYGQTCAANWGLPWGEEKTDLVTLATPVRKIDLSDGTSDDSAFDPAFERAAKPYRPVTFDRPPFSQERNPSDV
jgi:hypothetical protein